MQNFRNPAGYESYRQLAAFVKWVKLLQNFTGAGKGGDGAVQIVHALHDARPLEVVNRRAGDGAVLRGKDQLG